MADPGWPTVEIVPVGDFSAALAASLAAGLHGYQANVRVGPHVPLADPGKAPQLYSEDVIQMVARSLKGRVPAHTILISVTTHDLRARLLPKARFVFTTRIRPYGAVVSTARIDGRADGIPRDPALMQRRLRKLLIRNLLLLAFQDTFQPMARSVLYQGLSSTDDLDQMEEQSYVTGKDADWQWAASAGTACTQATAALNTPSLRRARRQTKTEHEAGALESKNAAIETALYRRLVQTPALFPAEGPARFIDAARAVGISEHRLAVALEKDASRQTVNAGLLSILQGIIRTHIYADESHSRACALHYAPNIYRR